MAKIAALAAILAAFALSSATAAPVATQGKRLIALSETERHWMTEEEVLALRRAKHETGRLGLGFMDITDDPFPARTAFRRAFPTEPSQQAVVQPLLASMEPDSVMDFLTPFTTFNNRYYTSDTGVEALIWLRDYMAEIALTAGRNDTSCQLFNHTWAQSSVICRIEGQDELANEVVIVGAHADSINSLSPLNGRAPGADDDGTGVAGFVEIFRAIVNSGFRPQRSIEFMGYAAEEVGLRGSNAIAADYVERGVNVYAVLQNEMSGYPGSQRKITILQDYVDEELTAFLEKLVSVYTELEFQRDSCGYGCSDHASFNSRGIPAICTAEAGPSGEVNPNMHRATDDLEVIDPTFTIEFAKLALGLTIELTEFSG